MDTKCTIANSTREGTDKGGWELFSNMFFSLLQPSWLQHLISTCCNKVGFKKIEARWSWLPHLIPLCIEKELPGLDEDIGAVCVPRHDGLLHHPPLCLPHHYGHTRGQEQALPVTQVCPAVNKRPADVKKSIKKNINVNHFPFFSLYAGKTLTFFFNNGI